jgi:hypothetical protein
VKPSSVNVARHAWAQWFLLVAIASVVGWVAWSVADLAGGVRAIDSRLSMLETNHSIATTPHPVDPSTTEADAGGLKQGARAMAEFATRLDHVEAVLKQLSATPAASGAGADSLAELEELYPGLSSVPRTEIHMSQDLETAHSEQATASDWGERSQQSLADAFYGEYTQRPFYDDYGGNISADCRETICRVTWTFPATVNGMTDEERADMAQRGSFELMSLAGIVPEGGSVRTVSNLSGDSPSISVLIERNSGGDGPTAMGEARHSPQQDPFKGTPN